MRIANKRLGKELMEIQKSGPPTGCKLLKADDLKEWSFELQVLGSSVYENETFAMRFRFSDSYPMEAPEVVFITTAPYRAPIHPHIYSNGHCCVSILSTEWSPVLNVSSVLLTMQSMLASCKKQERPKDNERYIRNCSASPRDTKWHFHDDTV